MPRLCETCGERRASLCRPKTRRCVCRRCFSALLEEEVHSHVTASRLFRPGITVALGASGGKDSTVLAYILKLLNDRHGYGLKLVLLSVDEGIAGYRDDSLATVKRNQAAYSLPLTVVSYEHLYGWTMDQVVQQVGTRGTCTYCGVLRRQALERGARSVGADLLATGHNADDLAETVLMNVLRGDGARLARCVGTLTSSHGEGAIPRCKPLMYCYEKEIVLYAYFNKLDYFSTECVYSPGAYRGRARALLKDLERVRPRAIIDVVHAAQRLHIVTGGGSGGGSGVTGGGSHSHHHHHHRPYHHPVLECCSLCGLAASSAVCSACRLLAGLRQGRARLGVGGASERGRG
uniref:Cytoplasmic tRNA 2-thiolation protein 1 n=1 Tax=Petromyzon marinus TaxID=7757 RepID=A0AAJ7SJW2_PETMA